MFFLKIIIIMNKLLDYFIEDLATPFSLFSKEIEIALSYLRLGYFIWDISE